MTYLVVSHASNMSSFDIAVISYGWTLLVCAYSIFISVAIWRSSNNYVVLKPKSRGNATLAKIAVVFGVIVLVGSLAKMLTESDSLPSSRSTSADEQLQFQATLAGLNANLPKKLDAVSTLNKIDIQDHTFIYYISVDTSIDDKNSFMAKMKEKIKSQCGNIDISTMLKSNYILSYF
jgi:hypothetical protein